MNAKNGGGQGLKMIAATVEKLKRNNVSCMWLMSAQRIVFK